MFVRFVVGSAIRTSHRDVEIDDDVLGELAFDSVALFVRSYVEAEVFSEGSYADLEATGPRRSNIAAAALDI